MENRNNQNQQVPQGQQNMMNSSSPMPPGLGQQQLSNFAMPSNLPYNMIGVMPDMSGMAHPVGVGMGMPPNMQGPFVPNPMQQLGQMGMTGMNLGQMPMQMLG